MNVATRLESRRWWLHSVWLLAVVASPSITEWNRRLSGPRPILGDVVAFEIGPDRVVYLADEPEGVFELHSVPLDGSASPVVLNDPLPVGGDVVTGFRISADGTRVVYTADQETNDVFELFSVPIDGSAAPIELSGTLAVGGDVRAELGISPDGNRVVYTADWLNDGDFLLISVPIDGSSGPLIINGPFVAGSDVEPDFQITPDGTRVVYRADEDTNGVFEIFSTSITTGGPVKLNDALVAGGDVLDFQVAPDASRVVFRSDADVDNRYELYSAPADGSAGPLELNGVLSPSGFVQRFTISPDSDTVVYQANEDQPGTFDLFSAPIDASGASIKVSGPIVNAGDVVDAAGSFAITPDSTQVVFVADKDVDELYELFVGPLDASSAPVQLNGALASGGDVQLGFRISPNGTRVVYTADQAVDERFELFSVLIGGGGLVTLNAPLVAGGDVDVTPDGFGIGPGGNRVAYRADQDTDGAHELYVVPINAITGPLKLNASPVEDGGVTGFRFSGGGARVLYLADQEVDEVVELHSVPVNGSSGPTKLNEPFSTNFVNGVVLDFDVTQERAVYLKHQNVPGMAELYSVPITSEGLPSKLNGLMVPDSDVTDFEVAAGGSRIVYRVKVEGSTDFDLFSAPVDGSADPVELAENLGHLSVEQYRISPDGSLAVVLIGIFTGFDLYSVPVDGSPGMVQLNAVSVAPGGFRIAPDGTRVVYAELGNLYSVPIDASQAPIQLNGTFTAGGGLSSFAISPDSTRVVYVADQDTNDVFELYAAPISVPASPVKLNGPLPPGADIHTVSKSFEIAADSARVVYKADPAGDALLELFSVPIDASASPVKLNGEFSQGGGAVFDFAISPDSARVVYLANQLAIGIDELFSVSIDASASAVKLNGDMVAHGDVVDVPPFQISADSARVLYLADQEVNDRIELWVAPIDASSAAAKLNGALVGGGDVLDFAIGQVSSRVAYRADQLTDTVDELFAVPIDGSSGASRVNGPLVPGGDVQADYEFGADGRSIFYRADQEIDGVIELYVTSPTRTLPHAGPTRSVERAQ